jgi:hypothetical protein
MNKDTIRPLPTGTPAPRWRLPVILISVAVVVAAALTGVVLLTRSGNNQSATPPGSPPATTTTVAPSSTAATTTAPVTEPGFHYQPLWPFDSTADAAAWQQSYRAGGHQPWHLDAGLTALSFTQGYLGYTNVDTVLDTTPSGGEVWVTVGFHNPNGQPVQSAALHLVRIGTGADAPWEVVGTRDTTLTLTTPNYGSTVRSPVTVGGRITGVDENLRVQILTLDKGTRVGKVSAIPAGGDDAPWQTTVTFTTARHTVLTIAVSTGGHIATVERFAITGVRS